MRWVCKIAILNRRPPNASSTRLQMPPRIISTCHKIATTRAWFYDIQGPSKLIDIFNQTSCMNYLVIGTASRVSGGPWMLQQLANTSKIWSTATVYHQCQWTAVPLKIWLVNANRHPLSLVADMQLYKRLCPSVGPLVCWSVSWSVGPLVHWSVGNAFVGGLRRAGERLISCIRTCSYSTVQYSKSLF